MSDFIIQIGDRVDPNYIAQKLQNRPCMNDRPTNIWRFFWGSVVIQSPPGRGYEPFELDGVLYAGMGHPRIIGCEHETGGSTGFGRSIAERWKTGEERNLFDSLTGTYALLRCNDREISILTDRMGAFPVYNAKNAGCRIVSFGTSVELMATVTQREQDWDQTSLAELLVFNNITFPYSSRNGIEELSPASITQIKMDSPNPEISTNVLWEPVEPISWQTDDEMIDRIEHALRAAAVEATRGAKSTAVTLSGGLDSRAVLAAIPKELDLSAVTYVTHENNETRVAQQVAKAAKARHHFAHRDEDYFATMLLERGIQLLGSERRAAAHGFCIPDNKLDHRFDVILGGQLSDTFLKHHYMPFDQREQIRPKGIRERIRNLIGMRPYQNGPNVLSTIGRHLALVHLNPTVREAVVARREARLKEVQAIRPVTGEEWFRFWPTSRQDDLAHVLGNLRLFSFDTLFMQRPIIDAAVTLSPQQRYAGRIANQAFKRVYGKLGAIENANTGTVASAGEVVTKRQRKRHTTNISVSIPGAAPWNNVQSSWANNVVLQQSHPMWMDTRAKLCGSPAIDLIDQLTEKPADTLIRTYADHLPPTFNQMIIQLGLCINQSLSNTDLLKH